MNKITNTLLGGIIATAIMSILASGIAGMLAGFMNVPLFAGWMIHFMIGILLAGIFFFIFLGRLPGNVIIQAILYSLVPFLLAQMMVMPMMGMGLFSSQTEDPTMMVMGSLVAHLVYGLVLGLYAKFIAKAE